MKANKHSQSIPPDTLEQAFLAILVMAMAFTFSCSSGGGDDPPPTQVVSSSSGNGGYGVSSSSVAGGGGVSSSSVGGGVSSSSVAGGGGVSSSSVGGGSSSSSACTAADNTDNQYCSNGTMKQYGSVTDDGGQTYKTVVIGTQTWMAENLNYSVPGSPYDVCYDDDPDYCTTYGRLYYWTTAMGIGGVQGVCPSGWHLPSNAEWNVLMTTVGGKETAGKNLKTTSGWFRDLEGEVISFNGEDKYGFSALPGGYHFSDIFFDIFESGMWWSATEEDDSNAHYWRMGYYNGEHLDSDTQSKFFRYSVRCVQD